MKLWLKIALFFLLAVILVFVGIAAFLGHTLTKTNRIPIEDNPAIFGLEYREAEFPSAVDGITLRGWYLPLQGSDRIIIMVHGAGAHRASRKVRMLDIASELIENEYSVLMFDLRGHGESDGDRISAGYFEKRDVLGAVEYAKGLGFEHIGVLGFSVGAASSLLAAVETHDIDAVVSDSSYADLNDLMVSEFKKRTRFPVIFLPPLLWLSTRIYRIDFGSVKPAEVVPRIAPRAILFIHGEQDQVIPVTHAYRLKEAARSPGDRLWVAPGTGHVLAFTEHPREYIDRITTFFDGIWR